MMSENPPLMFLDFEFSEDEQGWGTFDAMASTGPQQVATVRAEIAQVLAWAHASFPDMRAPLDEGGEWDFNLQGQQESSAHESIDFDEHSGRITSHLSPAGPTRHTVTLSLSGSPQFCDAFRAEFAPD
jgi:hypothetical protein